MQHLQHYLIQSETWSIWVGDKKICKNFSSKIHDIVHADEAKRLLFSKERNSSEEYDSSTWEALGKAMKESLRSKFKMYFVMKQ